MKKENKRELFHVGHYTVGNYGFEINSKLLRSIKIFSK